MSERLATPACSAVDHFLRAGMSVCPFARSCVAHYVEVSDVPRRDRDALLPIAHAFSTTVGMSPPHAMMVVGPPRAGFRETERWAVRTFSELYVVLAVVAGAAPEVMERFVASDVRPALLDRTSSRRVFLACGKEPLFAICMAPTYPERHPRYAPHPVVVVTWVHDVRVVPQNVVHGIRDRMQQAHGSSYDADALMLPLSAATTQDEDLDAPPESLAGEQLGADVEVLGGPHSPRG